MLDPAPLIDANMLALTRWIADYYACSWGQALDAVVPAGVKKHAGTRIATFLMVPEEARDALLAGSIMPPLSPKQAAVMEVLLRGELLSVSDVCRQAKCSPGLVHALRGRGLVRSVRKRLPVGIAAAGARAIAESANRFDSSAGGGGTRRHLIMTAEQAFGARAGRGRHRSRRFRAVLDPRSHRQRQDRSIPGGDRKGGGTGPRGDRAGAGNQPDAADDRAVQPAFRHRGCAA